MLANYLQSSLNCLNVLLQNLRTLFPWSPFNSTNSIKIGESAKVLRLIPGLFGLKESLTELVPSVTHREAENKRWKADRVHVPTTAEWNESLRECAQTHVRALASAWQTLLHTLQLFFHRGLVSGGRSLLVRDWHLWNFFCNPWRDKHLVFVIGV